MTPSSEELSGEPAASALRASLDHVAVLVPYLQAQVGRVPSLATGTAPFENESGDVTWLPCHRLVDDPRWLAQAVRASGAVLGTDDPVVAASIFVLGYAYRVLTMAVACMTASGVIPDSSALAMDIGVSRGRPSRVAYAEPAVLMLAGPTDPVHLVLSDQRRADEALAFLIDNAISNHLGSVIAAVRAEIRIGQRLLWGNVAASAATAFRTMEGCLGRWVEQLGTRFFELAPPALHHQGSYLAVERDGRHGWFWERTNCCLYDRLPGGVRCSDCSRTPEPLRRAAYEATLAE